MKSIIPKLPFAYGELFARRYVFDRDFFGMLTPFGIVSCKESSDIVWGSESEGGVSEPSSFIDEHPTRDKAKRVSRGFRIFIFI